MLEIDEREATMLAEQGFIGVILYDPRSLNRVTEPIGVFDFTNYLHRWIFSWMEEKVADLNEGRIEEDDIFPRLIERIRQLPEFHEMGGVGYLADLVDRAPPTLAIDDIANLIVHLAEHRVDAECEPGKTRH